MTISPEQFLNNLIFLCGTPEQNKANFPPCPKCGCLIPIRVGKPRVCDKPGCEVEA